MSEQHVLLPVKPLEERAGVELDRVHSVLSSLLLHHGAAELLVHHLHPVADAQDRDVDSEDVGIIARGIVTVDRVWSSRNNDASIPLRRDPYIAKSMFSKPTI